MKIGVVCAIPNEIKYFECVPNSQKKVGGKTFFNSTHAQHELIVVECGLGKVNAAMVATLLIHEFSCECLIFSGVAGGLDPTMNIGDVLVGESLIQFDYGAMNDGELQVYRAGEIPMGKPKNGIAFEMDSGIKAILKKGLPTLKFGTILTGDIFLQCSNMRQQLYSKFGAQAIEMEGAALAQVAKEFDVPTIVVRCLSDLAGANGEKINSSFIKKSAQVSFQTVQNILHIL